MALKIAINGFGRIGRTLARIVARRDDVELVAINDLASSEMMYYLLENDSVHGAFGAALAQIDASHFRIGNDSVKVFHEADPKKLDFASCGAEVVFECTGHFLTQTYGASHIEKGVKKVIFSAPAQDEDTPTYVLGVNAHLYGGEPIISNASCTTNCLAPVAKILDDAFGIEKGLMTTVHAYTHGQNLLDGAQFPDKRRSRAAGVNMVPTTTRAAKAVFLVLPQLEGKLHGQSVRVPTPDVSMVDLNVVLEKETSKAEISALFKAKAANELYGILDIDTRYRVSQDFVGSPFSATVIDDMLQVIGKNMVKVMAWYDNEWGYASRLIDMALFISKK